MRNRMHEVKRCWWQRETVKKHPSRCLSVYLPKTSGYETTTLWLVFSVDDCGLWLSLSCTQFLLLGGEGGEKGFWAGTKNAQFVQLLHYPNLDEEPQAGGDGRHSFHSQQRLARSNSMLRSPSSSSAGNGIERSVEQIASNAHPE